MPGMQSGIDRSYNGTNGLGGTSSAHTMGNIGGNDWSIDGAPDMGSGYSASYLPVSLAINEFKVATSQFDASVGHTSGSVISIMTKAGTNSFMATCFTSFGTSAGMGLRSPPSSSTTATSRRPRR